MLLVRSTLVLPLGVLRRLYDRLRDIGRVSESVGVEPGARLEETDQPGDLALAAHADRAAALTALEVVARRVPGRVALDTVSQYRQQKGVMTQLGVLFYGLVAVVALIGAISIVNTASTNLILRTRELGTMRAAGMTPGQLAGVVLLEGVYTALVAALLGVVAGAALARLLFTQVNALQGVPWLLPWGGMAVATLAAVTIGAVSALLPLRRLGRMSVVEALRGME